MDELIARTAANAGIEPAAARKAVAIIAGFLAREGPQESIQAMMDKLPGARELAGEAPAGSGNGIMGAYGDLTAAGLGMGAIRQVTKDFVAYAREQAGEAEVDRVIAAIPGLGQFV